METFQNARRAAAFVALGLLLAACAGGSGHGAAPAAALPQLRPHGSSTLASLTFAIEQPHARPRATSAGFVPPSTTYVRVKVSGATVFSSPPIQGQPSFTSTFSVPTGTDHFEVVLEDDETRVVSSGTTVENMKGGVTTPLVVTFQGVVSTAQLEIDGALTVGRASSANLEFVATDPDGETIDAGTYSTPVKISMQGSSPHLKFGGSVFDAPSDVIKISYDGRLMTAPIYVGVTAPKFPAVTTLLVLANAYTTFTTKGFVNDIALGPNHTLWFTECYQHGCDLGYIDAAGKVQHFQAVPYALHLVEGPDGNMWFTEGEDEPHEGGPTIGRITPSGKITEFRLRKTAPHLEFGTFAILVPRDRKAIWFTESESVGRITTTGHHEEYPMNHKFGPIRAKWFVEGESGSFYFDGSGVFKFNSANQAFTQYAALSGPLAWTTAGLFAHVPRLEELLTPGGQIEALDGEAIPMLSQPDGSLFGSGLVNGPTPLSGVSVQTLRGRTMTGPIYPAPLSGDGFFSKIVGTGSTYWGIPVETNTITRFTYKP